MFALLIFYEYLDYCGSIYEMHSHNLYRIAGTKLFSSELIEFIRVNFWSQFK